MSSNEDSTSRDLKDAPVRTNDFRFAHFLYEIVACFDPQLRHTYVNSAVEQLTGRPANEFIGKTNRELGMPEDKVEMWDLALDKAFRSGQPSTLQFTFAAPEGERLFLSQLLPQTDDRGRVVSVMTIARDANPSQLAGLTAEHFKAIIDSSDDAIIGKTLDGTVTSWNRGAQAIFGYSREEMIGRSLLILFPDERKDEERFIIERLLFGEKVDHFETVRIRKDGSPVHVSVTISPIRDADGVIIGASKVARDITPLKRQQERLQMALDAARTSLWDWDLRTGRVYRSAHYFHITGYEAEDDALGIAFLQRSVHPQDWPLVHDAIARCIDGHHVQIECEFRLISKTGEQGGWVLVKGQAVEHDSDGVPTRIIGTLSDVTLSKDADAALREREQRLSRVLEGSDQGYWDWNVQTSDLVVSPRWESMLGYEPGEMDLSNSLWEKVVHPDDFVQTMESVQQHLLGKPGMFEIEQRCRTKTGEWIWIMSRGKIVKWDDQGRPLMMSGTHTDISERKKYELSQRQALTVFTNSYEGIMVVDPRRIIVDINPAFTRITGYSREDVLDKSPRVLTSGRQGAEFYQDMWQSIDSTGHWTGEIWNRRKNGEIYAQMLSISAVSDVRGKVQHYIGIFSDISQLKAHEQELDRIAHYDPLTGAPNRRLLVDRLAQAIARADRNGNLLAVCYLDLDGFKDINDRYGHAVGDKLLVGVTENLKHVLRAEDTLARLGGDEFVLLLADFKSPQECSLILARILSSINVPLEIENKQVTVSASIGVSLYPKDHSDADTLMRHADQAMYLAKDAGKNRFHLFDPDSDRKAQEHRKFVDRLAVALEQEEFRLHYQPQVDLSTGDVVGVEALIRWQHPERGLLSPAEFLPHIEGSKLEFRVGKWVLHTALRQAQQWLGQDAAVNVSVNISARHLLSPTFHDDLRHALRTHPLVSAESLELEVLESSAIDDIATAASVLRQCRQTGVRLALDDFGTGYSSLTYLRKLPFDVLKIDQSFVRDMLKDPEDRGIVEGVIRLASAFNRSVIAEGVETLEHGAALMKLGCQLAQGYGIARPMPPEQFVEWSARWQSEKLWLALAPVGAD